MKQPSRENTEQDLTPSNKVSPVSSRSDSPIESSCPISGTAMLLVTSPDELGVAGSSPTPFLHQSGSAIQAAVYTTHKTDGYFGHSPNFSRHLVRREQQLASDPQDQGLYPDMNTDILLSSLPPPASPPPPLPPHHLTHYGNEGGAIADRLNSNRSVCCGRLFGRRTDMERHQRTARIHGGGRGRAPACPVKSCRFTSKFTRADNFRVHCRKMHRMDTDEIERYLKESKYQKTP